MLPLDPTGLALCTVLGTILCMDKHGVSWRRLRFRKQAQRYTLLTQVWSVHSDGHIQRGCKDVLL